MITVNLQKKVYTALHTASLSERIAWGCVIAVAFGIWFFTEIRLRKRTRLILGFLCIFLLTVGAYNVMNRTYAVVSLHAMCLAKMNAELKSSEDELVHQAIKRYKDVYDSTGNCLNAVIQMSNALAKE
jgi:thiol:disulfide interchange protein